MDSGNNSGSVQSSSSGGDEEFDSRAESFSATFLTHFQYPPTTAMFGPPPTPVRSDPVTNYYLQPPASTVPFPPLPVQSSSSSPSPSPSVVVPDPTAVVRNPRKRSRASRRAPTTVLTTDTSNFRAMVQEFTGVPSPPFVRTPITTTRFDLFGAPSTIRSNPHPPSSQLYHHHQYPLKPFPLKLQPPPTAAPSSLLSPPPPPPPLLVSSIVDSAAAVVTNSSTEVDYQLGLLKQPTQGDLDNNFTFQSLFQSRNPIPNSAFLIGSKSTQGTSLDIFTNSTDSSLNLMGGASDDFGLGSLVGASSARRSEDNNPETWVLDRGDYDCFKKNGNNSISNILNFSSATSPSSSKFQAGEKGSDNVVSARGGEGLVDSWICSTD